MKYLSTAFLVCMAFYATAQDNLFKNPVFQQDFPDPTAIRAADGFFYAYSTQSKWDGELQIVPIIKSADLVNWEHVGSALKEIPTWKTTPSGGVWAPNINFINNKYYLFYSFASWNDTNEGCGLAIADSPAGPFTDMGKLFDVSEVGVENCIDPFYINENGEHYLFFGSHQGIFGMRMNDDATKCVGEKFQIAANGIEAAYIHKHGDYYYFFGSNGFCCKGELSTYKITVARSKNLKGEYITQEGHRMLGESAEIGNTTNRYLETLHSKPALQGNDVLIGTGHNGEIFTDRLGDDWIIYHGIVKNEASRGIGGTWRRLCIDRVYWTEDGWCRIGTGTPTVTPSPGPVFD